MNKSYYLKNIFISELIYNLNLGAFMFYKLTLPQYNDKSKQTCTILCNCMSTDTYLSENFLFTLLILLERHVVELFGRC